MIFFPPHVLIKRENVRPSLLLRDAAFNRCQTIMWKSRSYYFPSLPTLHRSSLDVLTAPVFLSSTELIPNRSLIVPATPASSHSPRNTCVRLEGLSVCGCLSKCGPWRPGAPMSEIFDLSGTEQGFFFLPEMCPHV